MPPPGKQILPKLKEGDSNVLVLIHDLVHLALPGYQRQVIRVALLGVDCGRPLPSAMQQYIVVRQVLAIYAF